MVSSNSNIASARAFCVFFIFSLINNYNIQLPFHFPDNFLENLNKIHIVACGSAYHVGMTAKYIIEDMVHIPVMVDIASEFRYRNPVIDKNDLCIFISQSGETADTLASLRNTKKKGAFTLSIVNVPFSTIARESDGVIHTNAGVEIAVATTKAFSAQLSVIYLLSAFLSQKKGLMNDVELKKFTENVLSLPEKIQTALECDTATKELAEKMIDGLDFDYTKIERDSGTFQVSFKFNNIDFKFMNDVEL